MQKILFFCEKLLEKLASVNTVLYLVHEFEEALRKQRNPTNETNSTFQEITFRLVSSFSSRFI